VDTSAIVKASPSPVTAHAKAAVDSVIQNFPNGRRKYSASPVGKSARTPNTPTPLFVSRHYPMHRSKKATKGHRLLSSVWRAYAERSMSFPTAESGLNS
jgi:hypothetical protein